MINNFQLANLCCKKVAHEVAITVIKHALMSCTLGQQVSIKNCMVRFIAEQPSINMGKITDTGYRSAAFVHYSR